MHDYSSAGKKIFKIAIQPDFLALGRDPKQSFSRRWIELLEQAGHEVCLVDAFTAEFFDQIKGCDGFLWWFPPIPFPRDMARRLMLALGHAASLPVFPEWQDCWHFDDKAAQSYLLQAAQIPVPRTWVFWQSKDALEFCRTAQYPLVIKLSSGVYSQNVRLLQTPSEAEYWHRRLFHSGVLGLDRPAASPFRRALKRFRAAARTLIRGQGPGMSGMDFHKDYFLVQEFVPDNAFDTRVTIIGKRAFGCRRFNRPQDFRASGSGNADFDPSSISRDSVRLAFQVAAALHAQTICMDILRQAEKPVICEVSYYFEGWTISACPGHWELEGAPETGQLKWVEGKVRPEDMILDDFLARLANKQAGIPAVYGE